MRKVFVMITAGVVCAGIAACGPVSKQTRKDGDKTQVQAAAKPAPAKVETKEDLSYREIIQREFKYVEGVKEDAQDAFGQGVLFLHEFPPMYDRAVESFQKAIQIDPGFAEAYINLAQIYERQRKTDDAVRLYQQAADKTDRKLDARAYIGKVYLGLANKARDFGNFAEADRQELAAKQIFDEVIAEDAENIQANNSLALYWLFKGDTKTAESYVQKVLLKAPEDVVALNTRGLINLQAGNLKIAKWVFEQKALRFDPNSIEALTNLGITYLRMGNTPMGVTSFEKALQIDPNNFEARMNVAAIYLNYLHYNAAREMYEEALKMVPDSVEAMIGLGSCYAGLLDPQKAVDTWLKGMRIAPKNTDLYLRVAKMYETKLNSLEKAVEYYQKYLEVAQAPENDPIRGRIPVLQDMIKNGGMLMPPEEPMMPEETPPADGAVAPAPEAAPAVEPAPAPAPEAAPAAEPAPAPAEAPVAAE